MVKIINELSRTFNEYLFIPSYSDINNVPNNVNLKTPLVKFKKGFKAKISLNIPMVSAIMQSISDDKLSISLAKEGGVSFIYCSQSIDKEALMVKNVKNFKAGFVVSDSNVNENTILEDILKLKLKTKHSTIAVTNDGTSNGKLLGLITDRDYCIDETNLKTPAKKIMTPFNKLITANDTISLNEANKLIWKYKINQLPIIDKNGNLKYLVFRKDFNNHKKNFNELLDEKKRYVVGAGINTHDYKERVPKLIEAGVDVLCIDSSEGFTEWQKKTITWIKKKYKKIPIGAGNIVDAAGFRFLAKAGADFIKVGIGGGSICITRETKGIGRGQASAIIDVCNERDKYFKETGYYIPICSDGGIASDYHITLALAMGADFVMLGRYFARFDESPTNKITINGNIYKEYWGEGSMRARNWQRYNIDKKEINFKFEEGIDSYVPYAGKLSNNIKITLDKIKSTMCNCGALNISELRKKAILTVISSSSMLEGKSHDIIEKNKIINLK